MSSLLHQGRASYAFFERNWNLYQALLGMGDSVGCL